MNPQSPVKLLGFLMLPPKSLPNPRIDPPDAIRADSPPDEPPEIRVVSMG